MEAARSVGMSYGQAMRYVILPQAVRNVLPPLGNDFIAMLKDSSLVSVLGVQDITQMGKVYSASTFRFFETYNVVAYLYLVMTVGLALIFRRGGEKDAGSGIKGRMLTPLTKFRPTAWANRAPDRRRVSPWLRRNRREPPPTARARQPGHARVQIRVPHHDALLRRQPQLLRGLFDRYRMRLEPTHIVARDDDPEQIAQSLLRQIKRPRLRGCAR